MPAAAEMSCGDVVCSGWLVKSPPESKLRRFTWRKRWFILRRGRMSGSPDALEYYQSRSSRKPIRSIDLRECEVRAVTEPLALRRELRQKHPFTVKTSARIFYLVARTEEERSVWIQSISQICQFALLKDAESSDEGFPPSPAAAQRTPAALPASPQDRGSERGLPSNPSLGYFFLSQCETGGSVDSSRRGSVSNSESSLEQRSWDPEYVFSPRTLSSSSFSRDAPGRASLLSHRLASIPPFSAPPCTRSSSSPLPRDSATAVFQFDEPSPSLWDVSDRPAAPPLPPKPNPLPDRDRVPRRISFWGPELQKIGQVESGSLMDNRPSLSRLSCSAQVPNTQDDYVPMASPSAAAANHDCGSYSPMSPIATDLLCCPGPPMVTPCPEERLPPPVQRHLKPPGKARPPPLDLRNLSTIRESLPPPSTTGGGWEDGDDDEEEDEDTEFEPRLITGSSTLDYLALDFNPALPSPLLKQFHRPGVDYVQVDERRTQALQSTRMEWTDVRQSRP